MTDEIQLFKRKRVYRRTGEHPERARKHDQGARGIAEKRWRDAIIMAVNERAAGPYSMKKLRRLAEVVVDAALAGDMQAAKEVGDRLDGKATATTQITGADGGAIKTENVSREEFNFEELRAGYRAGRHPVGGTDRIQ